MPKKQLTISKRAKGFPIALPMTHWLLIRQHYAWLKTIGGVTEEMDEALTLVPIFEITADDVKSATIDGDWEGTRQSVTVNGMWTKPALHRRKTIRVRASQVTGMVQLLRAVAAFHVGGQLGDTFRARADKLESISVLDHLVDASR